MVQRVTYTLKEHDNAIDLVNILRIFCPKNIVWL